MAQDAIAYITDKYIKLTDVEKRLADYIISNYDMAVNLSVQALAENANVSPAAVVRFARQMGFEGYKAFRLFLVANRPAHEDFILDLKKERGTVETQVEKVINANIEAMRLTEESLDYSVLEKVALAFKKANQVIFFGTGTSYIVCSDSALKFQRLGKITGAYSDLHSATVAMANMTGNDIFIAVSHSGQNNDTCKAAQIAKSCGINTLAVTTFSESRISSIADYVLLTKTRESPLHKIAITSRISQFAVMDSLLMACMVTDYDRCISHIDKLSKKLKLT